MIIYIYIYMRICVIKYIYLYIHISQKPCIIIANYCLAFNLDGAVNVGSRRIAPGTVRLNAEQKYTVRIREKKCPGNYSHPCSQDAKRVLEDLSQHL